jgi:hypothetical protein
VVGSLDQFNTTEIHRRLDRYTKAIFVRHPLERLVSAFRSKFQTVTPKTEFYREYYGNIIARRFRKPQSAASAAANFQSIVPAYMLDFFRLRRAPREVPINDITFPEFVRFIAEHGPDGFDQHWRPISNLCRPGDIQYDFVGRYERLEEDANRLLCSIGADFSFPRCCPGPGRSLAEPAGPRCRAASLAIEELTLSGRRCVCAYSSSPPIWLTGLSSRRDGSGRSSDILH